MCHVKVKMILQFQVTVLHLVPPMAVMLAQHPNLKKYDLSNIHTALVGAAPLKQEQAEDLMKALNITAVIQGIYCVQLKYM